MRRPRFTIADLLAIVNFLGVGLAALRAANDAWDSGVLGFTLALLLLSVLLVIHRSGIKGAYWLGFALFGWTYLAISMVPSIEARLPTSKALYYLDSKVPGRTITITGVLNGSPAGPGSPVTAVAFSPDGRSIVSSQANTVRLWDVATGRLLAGPNGTMENFERIGHSLLALVMAFLGAHISRFLFVTGREKRAESSGVRLQSDSGVNRT